MMWLLFNSGFLSIVSDRNSTENLLVRARVRGHIQEVFPSAKVFTDSNADYLFRTVIIRDEVAAAVADSIRHIDYDNFKNSVASQSLHDAYLDVWRTMRHLQDTMSQTKAVPLRRV